MTNRIYQLLTSWCTGLQRLQLDQIFPGGSGGIFCPACSRIHGRSLDAIYAFITLYRYTKNHSYLQSATNIYVWSQQLHYPNGSYGNDLHIVEWNGITVFNLITLLSTIIDHGSLLEPKVLELWQTDAHKMSDFIYETFTIKTGNINYPASAIYALYLASEAFKDSKYLVRAQELRNQILPYFTPEQGILYGEGYPQDSISHKGNHPIDIAYNIDESLTYLGLYSTAVNDKDLITVLKKSFKSHTQFFLEDGGLDNSWCSRSYKWAYWGSRTSDGCQLGLLHFSRYLPELSSFAEKNLALLEQSTHQNILYGGLGYKDAGQLPCVHHTFCHAKSLAKLYHLIQTKEITIPVLSKSQLRRKENDELRIFSPEGSNVQVVQNAQWRATLSDYDWQYCKGATPTGGALTLLYANGWGPLIAAGLNHAVMPERFNMQDHIAIPFIGATPRIECLNSKDQKLQSIDYLKAKVSFTKTHNSYRYNTTGKLSNQLADTTLKDLAFIITYTLSNDQKFIIDYCIQKKSSIGIKALKFALPLIIRSDDILSIKKNKVTIQNKHGTIIVESQAPFMKEIKNGFNYQPGFAFKVFYCKIRNLKAARNRLTFSFHGN